MLSWLTGFHGLPYLARSTFRYEQAGLIASSVGLSVAAGGFCQLFLKKGFDGSDWLLAILVASAPAGNMLAGLLSGQLRRWRYPAVATGCMVAAAAATAPVALLNLHPRNGLTFTLLMGAVVTAMMTSVQARAAIWQANYPAGSRGSIVSRNFILQTIFVAMLALAAGALLDWRIELYRLMYPVGAASFVVAGLCFNRIRVRREGLRLQRHADIPRGFHPVAAASIFRRDRRFAWYMALQMVLGMSTLAVLPVLPKILAEVFEASYSKGNLALTAAPLTAQVIMIPLLGILFDRISIFRFRGYGAAVWALSRLMLTVSLKLLAMPLLVISMFVCGLAESFGRLAWSMGHMAFTDDENAHLYMSAHMILTGMRGLTMPFVGMWLYTHVVGNHILWITGVVQLVVMAGFWATDRYDVRASTRAATPSRAYVP